ncbi:hypothetical protein Tco_0805223 [Tanacetum coccineum]
MSPIISTVFLYPKDFQDLPILLQKVDQLLRLFIVTVIGLAYFVNVMFGVIIVVEFAIIGSSSNIVGFTILARASASVLPRLNVRSQSSVPYGIPKEFMAGSELWYDSLEDRGNDTNDGDEDGKREKNCGISHDLFKIVKFCNDKGKHILFADNLFSFKVAIEFTGFFLEVLCL